MAEPRPPDIPPGRSPDRRRHGYVELAEQMETFERDILRRLRRFFLRSLLAFAVIGIASAVAIFGFGLVLKRQSDITNDIQKQRFNSLFLSCTDTNDRNRDVNTQIDSAITKIPLGPKRTLAEKQSGPFRLIISAAVPLTDDCYAYAKSRVKGTG